MKRIYFTAVPLQTNFILYPPKELNLANIKLTNAPDIAYPIVRLMLSTMQAGDTAEVIAIRQYNDINDANWRRFKNELIKMPIPENSSFGLKDITIPENQNQDKLIGLFNELISLTEDNSICYADMTFGTKTYPIVLFAALNYAHKICKNTDVDTIIYQEQTRQQGQPAQTTIYDVTALFNLSEVVDAISNTEIENKKDMIKALLEQLNQ